MLPVTIDTAFKRTYSATFEHLFQQTQSELGVTVRNEFQEGEMKLWDFIGPTSVQWDLPRYADTPNIPTTYTRRKCVLRKATWGEYIDNFDKVQMLKDPTSDTIRAAVAAMNRAKDERVLEAIAAIAMTGKEGSTPVNSYDVGECRLINGNGAEVTAGSNFSAAGAEIGLTLATIARIGKLLDDASVPPTDRHLVANTNQKWYLLGSTKATSADYNGVRLLARGEIDTYLGFTFHWLPSDRFTVSSFKHTSDAIECAAYHKSSVLLAVNKDISTTVDTIPEKQNSTLAQAEMFIGSVRLQGPGVVRMLLKKEPGIDFEQK